MLWLTCALNALATRLTFLCRMMTYELFLFDLDDTLLDFRASERLSFTRTLESFGLYAEFEPLYAHYQRENNALWQLFEQGKTTKEHLKVERFRKTFAAHGIEIDPAQASTRYLDALPHTVVLMEHAAETCAAFSARGEIGIITNGIGKVQNQRIANSAIAPYISFISVSDACGYAKPDTRFFEFSTNMAARFDKKRTIIIGDRLEADILGAQNFGIDSCWFNPHGAARPAHLSPTYEIQHLSQLETVIAA